MRLLAFGLLFLVACESGVSPSDCIKLCGGAGVCSFSDDQAGHGECVCKAPNGDCVGDDASEP